MQNLKSAVRLSRLFGLAALAAAAVSCASAPPQDRSAPGRNADDEASRSSIQKAIAAFDSGDLESALAQVDAALGLNGDRGDALGLRAAIETVLGNVNSALADLGIAISSDPADPALYKSRATLLARQRRFEASLRDIRKAVDLSDTPAYKNVLATVLVLAGNYREAGGVIDELTARYPYDPGSVLPEYRLVYETQGQRAAEAFADRVLADARAGRYGSSSGFVERGIELMSGRIDFRDILSAKDERAYSAVTQDFTVSPAQASAQASGPATAQATGPATAQPAEPPPGALNVFLRPLAAENLEPGEGAMITALVRDGVVNGGKVRLVDAEARESALKELEVSYSGLAGAAQDAKLGAFLECGRSLSGLATEIDGRRYCNLVLTDTASGGIVRSTFVDWASPEDAPAAVGRALDALGLR
ncbi:MAG TPA: hypothetical protein VMV90_03505 [Rectinemataceae bacterium]|nr:hypothetical protein [Rectinemataceae bacterium]